MTQKKFSERYGWVFKKKIANLPLRPQGTRDNFFDFWWTLCDIVEEKEDERLSRVLERMEELIAKEPQSQGEFHHNEALKISKQIIKEEFE